MFCSQVLCGTGFRWIASANGHVPDGAVCTGTTNDGEPLFIGRVQHKTSIVPGKIHKSHHCLYIPYGTVELSYKEYEVLVHISTVPPHGDSISNSDSIDIANRSFRTDRTSSFEMANKSASMDIPFARELQSECMYFEFLFSNLFYRFPFPIS